jgi:hypothetical protein
MPFGSSSISSEACGIVAQKNAPESLTSASLTLSVITGPFAELPT